MGDLFSHDPYPAQPGAARDRDTSVAAAKDMKVRQGSIQAKVLAALLRHGPLASHQLVEPTGVTYRSVQPRTAELARRTAKRPAYIMDSGLRANDPATGKQAIVWKLTPMGEAAAGMMAEGWTPPPKSGVPLGGRLVDALVVPHGVTVTELAECLRGFVLNRREFTLAPTAHPGMAGAMERLFDQAELLVRRWQA